MDLSRRLRMVLLFDKHLGSDWLKDHNNSVVWGIDDLPEVELWDVHDLFKVKLIDYFRYRARKRWFRRSGQPQQM
jgi:hypothetical protein